MERYRRAKQKLRDRIQTVKRSRTKYRLDDLTDGVLPVTDILIDGRGSLVLEQDYQSAPLLSGASGTLTATLDTSYVFGTGVEGSSVTTDTVTVTPSGGTGPYSYLWTKVSGDTFTPTDETAASTAFTSTFSGDTVETGVYAVTVTDSTPGTPLSITLSVNITIKYVFAF